MKRTRRVKRVRRGWRGLRPRRVRRGWRFTLRGARALTHRALSALLARIDGPVAWGRPGANAVVIMSAADFAALTGRTVPATTFAPSRFCRTCARFTGGRACLECDPPTTAPGRRS